jgi:hypothetical protein
MVNLKIPPPSYSGLALLSKYCQLIASAPKSLRVRFELTASGISNVGYVAILLGRFLYWVMVSRLVRT